MKGQVPEDSLSTNTISRLRITTLNKMFCIKMQRRLRTDYATGWTIRGSIPDMGKRCFTSKRRHAQRGPGIFPMGRGRGGRSKAAKRREFDESPPLLSRIRISGATPLLHHMHSWRRHGNHLLFVYLCTECDVKVAG
jgi:hypothetical protein